MFNINNEFFVNFIRNVNPPIWYNTNVRLFEVQRVQ